MWCGEAGICVSFETFLFGDMTNENSRQTSTRSRQAKKKKMEKKKVKIKTGFSRMQSSTVYICLDICARNNEGRAGGFCFISQEKNLNKNKTGESITTGDVCNENK